MHPRTDSFDCPSQHFHVTLLPFSTLPHFSYCLPPHQVETRGTCLPATLLLFLLASCPRNIQIQIQIQTETEIETETQTHPNRAFSFASSLARLHCYAIQVSQSNHPIHSILDSKENKTKQNMLEKRRKEKYS